MKKYLLLFVSVLLSSAVIAQTNQATSIRNVLGLKSQLTTEKDQHFYKEKSIVSAEYFQNIRALEEINTVDSADAYPWISADGLRIYFSKGASINSIMFSERPDTNSLFSTPAKIYLPLNYPFSCWLTEDELSMYVLDNATTLYMATRNSLADSFTDLQSFQLKGLTYDFIASISMNTTKEEIYGFVVIDGKTKIAQYNKTNNFEYTYTKSLPLPDSISLGPGQLSKDGLSYIFSIFSDSLYVLHQLTRTSESDTFAISSLQQLQIGNDSLSSKYMPSLSANMKWLVFAGSNEMSWTAHDLYIASNSKTVSATFDTKRVKTSFRAYPNPSTGIIKLDGAISKNLSIEVYNSVGQKVMSQPRTFVSNNFEIDLKGNTKGIYFLRLTDDKNLTEIHKLILE